MRASSVLSAVCVAGGSDGFLAGCDGTGSFCVAVVSAVGIIVSGPGRVGDGSGSLSEYTATRGDDAVFTVDASLSDVSPIG